MSQQQKLEKVLDLLLSEDSDRASELLHQIIVEKARTIYESIVEDAEEDKDDVDSGDEVGGEANKVGDMTEQAWLKVIGVNLNGVFNCMKHELTQMVKQKKGVIVNMASILSKVGFSSSSHYVAAKHGVIGLTQTAAMEYATEGIRINAICPGFIETPLLTNAGITEDSDIQKYIVGLHPMKRFGKSEEVASGFIFLASDDSSFVTGAALDIDGGYLAQ